MRINFSLPLPPSVNSAYGGGSGQQRYKTRKAKDWHIEAMLKSRLIEKIKGEVNVSYTFYFPSKHPRDLANYEKLTTDLLVDRGIIEGDDWKIIKRMEFLFGGIDRQNPRVEITLESKS